MWSLPSADYNWRIPLWKIALCLTNRHFLLFQTDKPVLNLVLLGENNFAIEHHTIALQCNVKSNPPLVNKIQWFFNGQLLSTDNKGKHNALFLYKSSIVFGVRW